MTRTAVGRGTWSSMVAGVIALAALGSLAALGGCAASERGAAANESAPPSSARDLTSRVKAARLRRDVDTLSSFGTRHMLSQTDSTSRGIGAARRWIAAEFEAINAQRVAAGLAPMRIWLDTHRLEPGMRRVDVSVEIASVIAEIPGALEERGMAERVYVSGHYDSRNSDEMDRVGDAPGANDDASGVAVMLETARALALTRPDHTLVFVAFDAEEAGLYGSQRHVASLVERGARVRAVLNFDIVGDPTSPSGRRTDREIHLFSEGVPAIATSRADDDPRARTAAGTMFERLRREGALGDSGSRQLARYVEELARAARTRVQPTLVFRTDRFLRGGDHTPFHEAGYPAVRFTEVDEDYNRQHQNVRVENGVQFGDLPEFVDENYLADITRLNVLVAASLGVAPTSPPEARIVVASLSNDTLLRWNASPEPNVAGYEVVWRSTTSPRWERVMDVGRASEARVPVSKDAAFFGVRAYNDAGVRSLVSFCFAARE